MEILVCVKRVPHTVEDEIKINADGTDIKRDDLVYTINEWDNYAVEEAIRIRDKVGGSVTLVTVDTEAGDEVLRRGLAMGADRAFHCMDHAFEASDGRGIARILQAAVEKGSYDLILTGAQADDAAGQVGGMLAARLGWPYASIVNRIEVLESRKIKAYREVAGGNLEIYEMRLPCVLSIQTGINEPRYVSIRGVKRASRLDIPVYGTGELNLAAETIGKSGSWVWRSVCTMPEMSGGAEMVEGATAEVVGKLVEMLKARGGIR
jgi:electron transfer flavoprotein beta subunit